MQSQIQNCSEFKSYANVLNWTGVFGLKPVIKGDIISQHFQVLELLFTGHNSIM